MPQQQFHITAAQVFVHLCCGSRKKTNKNKNTTYRWWFQPLLDKYLSTSQSSQNRSELWTKQSYSQEKNIYNINNIHPTKYPLKKGPSSSPPSTEKTDQEILFVGKPTFSVPSPWTSRCSSSTRGSLGLRSYRVISELWITVEMCWLSFFVVEIAVYPLGN